MLYYTILYYTNAILNYTISYHIILYTIYYILYTIYNAILYWLPHDLSYTSIFQTGRDKGFVDAKLL